MNSILKNRRFAAIGLSALLLTVCLPSRASADPGCPADLNGDGTVGSPDLALLLGSWGGPGPADLDGSGVVSSADLALLLGSWGACPLVRLSEPGTMHSPPGAPETPSFSRLSKGMWSDDWSDQGIYAFSGEFHLSSVDMVIPGRGLDFIWARKYRSRVGADSAVGHGWDFSYNIRAFLDAGGVIVVLDGDSRSDRYSPQPGGTWTSPELFRVMRKNPDGTYTLGFPHGGKWNFKPFDGTTTAGKITSIVDRNDNAISFDYDAAGRQVSVHDTLGHVVLIGHDFSDHIISVTDWTGRQLKYEYYALGEAGGSPGDLKSVTTPAVIGTPNGNDFPLGKKTVYTYTTGFADDRLNHNLLTITDPKGQTWLVNQYAPSTNPGDPDFDRCKRQTIGNAGDVIDYVYVAQTPSPANAGATKKAIINDRVGNVSECFFDGQNRMVMCRDFTGRANPDVPTTDASNRPANRLRATDPDYFETRWQYNADALVTRTDYPNGRFRTCIFDIVVTSRLAQSNMLQCTDSPGPLGGDQSVLISSWEYAAPPGQTGFNFPTLATDPNGNSEHHTYDTHGNRVHTTHCLPSIIEDWEYNTAGQMTAHILPDNGSGHRRRDVYEYYGPADGPQNGYLARKILDYGEAGIVGLQLTTTYEYDALGRRIRNVDAKAQDELCTYNALDQVVRELSRPVGAAPATVRYETLYAYDANDNLIRRDVENRDETGALQSNNNFTTTFEYDILDCVTRMAQEVDPTHDVVTEYAYDSNRNQTLIRYGQATNGADPHNTQTTLYDERNMVFRQIRAEGAPDASTTQWSYDGDGMVTTMMQGVEDAASPHMTQCAYDGYGRIIKTTDAMGNMTIQHYDANGNVLSVREEGELIDGPGSASNVRLAETTHQYDAMDRRIRCDAGWFDAATQAPISDGAATTQWVYNDCGQVVQTIDDLNRVTQVQYDGANRISTTHDADGNSATCIYDPNSNVIEIDESDLSTAGTPGQSFVTTYEYDGVDRCSRTIDSKGNSCTHHWNSRGVQTVEVDALGHIRRETVDGLCRRILLEADLDGDGVMTVADISTSQVWDDSSRLLSRTDDNGNTTQYQYDSLNRQIRCTYADSTFEVRSYDVHDNPVSTTDASGTTCIQGHDPLNRPAIMDFTPGPGVSNATTVEQCVYDGLSRMIQAQNDASVTTLAYDSLSNQVSESQNGAFVITPRDVFGNPSSVHYPGGRVIDYAYDSLNRVRAALSGPVQIGSCDYVGGRLARCDLIDGSSAQLVYDGVLGVPDAPGDFGARQIAATNHASTVSSTGMLDSRTYGWDPAQKKTIVGRAAMPGIPSQSRTMSYDRADRMVQFKIQQELVVLRNTSFTLDGVGNRQSAFGPGTPCAGNYVMSSALPEPADFQMNQYTQTPCDFRQYDRNGNLKLRDAAAGAHYACVFDVHDRLVELRDSATLHRLVIYAYDDFGRRISKTTDPDGPAATTTVYHYDGEDVIEEQTAGVALRTFAYWPHMHQIAHRISMSNGPDEFFYHCDDLGSPVAITNAAGQVIERCEYDDNGRPSLTDALGNPIAQSLIGNPYYFQGMRLDLESRLYLDGARSMDPATGRYVSGNRQRHRIVFNDRDNEASAESAFADNNPWSGGGGGGGVCAIEPRDILKTYFETGDVPTQDQFYRIVSPRDHASGLPTGKRMHKPVRVDIEVEPHRPLARTFEKGWPCRYEGPRIDAESGVTTTGKRMHKSIRLVMELGRSGSTYLTDSVKGPRDLATGQASGKGIRKNISVTLRDHGASHARMHTLGQREWEDITLIGPLTAERKDMLQWYTKERKDMLQWYTKERKDMLQWYTKERKDMLQWYNDMAADPASGSASRTYRPGRPIFGNINFDPNGRCSSPGDGLPIRWCPPDLDASTTMHWVLEVRFDRIEMK